MSIKHVEIARDPKDVNPKYLKEDGTPQFYPWDGIGVSGGDYYLQGKQEPDYTVVRDLLSGARESAPPGFMVKELYENYVGRVIEVVTKTERIMSDVWEEVTRALVYSPEIKGKKRGEYSSPQKEDYDWIYVHTFGMDNYSYGTAEVDAPKEMIEVWKKHEEFKAKKLEHERRESRQADERARIDIDKVVVVARGRKVPQGTVGKVFWMGSNSWGETAGIALTPMKEKQVKNGKQYTGYKNVVFVSLQNLEVVGKESEAKTVVADWAWLNQKKDGLSVTDIVQDFDYHPGADSIFRVLQEVRMSSYEKKVICFNLLSKIYAE